MTPKDLFSTQSRAYARFRPRYPKELFTYLAGLAPSRELAWDCATGNGQAAVELAESFDRVIATDFSEKQIAAAERRANIEYRLGSAENPSLESRAADLITVAQAFHWLDSGRFYDQCARVLKPRGVLAIWSYSLAQVTPAVDSVVLKLYREVLGPYWEPERKLVDEGYKGVRLPFPETRPPAFEMRARWTLEHLFGYLGTWSALQTYLQKNGSNPLKELAPLLTQAWGSAADHEVRWNLALRVGISGS